MTKEPCSVMDELDVSDYDSQEAINVCLSCSLTICELENHMERISRVRNNMRLETIRLRNDGLAMKPIANILGISKRTVYRLLKND